jgi:VIT1/CCC1 family predicted Fe2+/Mn2+ transporter
MPRRDAPDLDLGILLANLHDERQAVHLYGVLETTEAGAAGRLFRDLRAESGKQAALWARILLEKGGRVPPYRPGARVRAVAWMLRRLGARRMLPVLSAMKVRGLALYRGGTAAAGPDGGAADAAPGLPEESWHRGTHGGGALRAAVFGINDGLVSNAGLILGVAGADPAPEIILLAGVAGMLAGGFSMAAGEYVSVRTQKEFLEHQIALERSEIATMPEEEIEELAMIYRAKGLDGTQAERLARTIVSDPERGLETLAREELGLDPRALGSPIQAAVASFLSFAGGAFLPLLPYLLGGGRVAFAWTIAVTLASLLLVGGLMSLFTGRRPLWSALRMALLGSAAGAATWLIGRLLGVAV